MRRLGAMAYETLLLTGLLCATLLLPHLLIGAFTHRIAAPFLLWAQLFLTLLGYCVWFWSHGRRTLAMKTWRLILTRRDGQPLQPTQALLRYLLAWPSILAGGLGILWAIIDPERQFLHDRLAGTRLVQESTISAARPTRSSPLPPP